MAVQRRNTGSRAYSRTDRGTYSNSVNGTYVYGNTVRKLNVQQQMEDPQRKQLSREVQVNRAKAKHMNLGYVLFLAAALALAGMILINYVRVQAEITTTAEYITRQEKTLNNLRVSNDEALTRIESRLDLEEVRRVAIGELGMTYPQEGQIITYEAAQNDYVRRIADED